MSGQNIKYLIKRGKTIEKQSEKEIVHTAVSDIIKLDMKGFDKMTYEGIDRDAQHLADLMYAPAYTKICIAALELDVFSNLTDPKTAEELAKTLGWHVKNTEFLLDTLTGMGFLHKNENIYQNADCSRKYLVRGTERFMGDFMQMYVGLSGYEQTDLAALVREGPQAAPEENVSNISFADQFAAMRRAQSGARSYETVRILNSIPEYASAKKLLDLGCGSGMLGIAAAKDNPHLDVVVYDTPAMEPGIRESIELSGLQKRVTAIGGDYLSGDIGSEYDIIIAFATLNFAKHAMEDVMRKLRAVLNPNGVLITFGDSIHSSNTLPADMLAGWLPYTLKGMDFRMPGGLVSESALAAGFRNVCTTTVPAYSGSTEINIIRK